MISKRLFKVTTIVAFAVIALALGLLILFMWFAGSHVRMP